MNAPTEADEPTSDEIRAALDRVTASDVFRQSPQLTAFLRFVVDTSLRGESDSIKGYTIAVMALGRSDDFDPQNDPIVRTEAGRLRRALARYYVGPGATDPVVIDIPLGGYVPTFRRRLIDASALVPSPSHQGPFAGFLPDLSGWHSDIRRFALVLLPAVVLALLGIAIVFTTVWSNRSPTDQQLMATFRAGHGLPVVVVQSAETIGTPTASTIAPDRLTRKLRDALARFDEIHVPSEQPAPGARSAGIAPRLWTQAATHEYRLAETADYEPDGTTDLAFTLLDVADGIIVWSRNFRGVEGAQDPDTAEDAIVRAVDTSIAQPWGVIHAHEHGKADLDPRYACLLDALEYWQGFDVTLHGRIRGCLEHMTELDPTFAEGFMALEAVYSREYYNDLGSPADPPPLDRALKAAQRAISLKPQSARAHTALASAYYAKGEIAAGLAEGETALSLNPLDPFVIISYGIRLVEAGQINKGEALLGQATAGNIVINPGFMDFSMFLIAYLRGDHEAASRYANLSLSDGHQLGIVARALAAAAKGDRQRAVLMRDRLVRLYPEYGGDPHRAIAKFIPSTEIVNRLAGDLTEIRAMH